MEFIWKEIQTNFWDNIFENLRILFQFYEQFSGAVLGPIKGFFRVVGKIESDIWT